MLFVEKLNSSVIKIMILFKKLCLATLIQQITTMKVFNKIFT